jgi:biotin-dependent carboxylase-like uncharacterized protein
MIEILTTGLLNSVQDLGRTGFRNMGVGLAGAMDGFALRAGNALVGNPLDEAGVEVAFFPFRLKFHTATRFAVTGADCDGTLDGDPIPPFWTRTARPGQVLALSAPRFGVRAYITIAGGLDLPVVLGSRSTDLKAGFGGFEGRGLKRGDCISLRTAARATPQDTGPGFGLAPESVLDHARDAAKGFTRLRVLPAAEHDDFTANALATFATGQWILTKDANRIGYRLEGPSLAMTARRELFSHGIVPGTVQVPPSGQPIIPLSDANTCGGYPKIATVIEPDLWRLAQSPSGCAIRFVEIGRGEAIAALRDRTAEIEDIRKTVDLVARWKPAA